MRVKSILTAAIVLAVAVLLTVPALSGQIQLPKLTMQDLKDLIAEKELYIRQCEKRIGELEATVRTQSEEIQKLKEGQK